jgi:hypothetical protein
MTSLLTFSTESSVRIPSIAHKAWDVPPVPDSLSPAPDCVMMARTVATYVIIPATGLFRQLTPEDAFSGNVALAGTCVTE